MVFRSEAKQKIIVCVRSVRCVSGRPGIASAYCFWRWAAIPLIRAATPPPRYTAFLPAAVTGVRHTETFRNIFTLHRRAQLSPRLQAAALANIRTNPAVFLHSLLQNTEGYVTGAFKFGSLTHINPLLTTLWLIGIAWCVAHARHALALLLLAMSVGEIISVPLMFTGPSDHRVLAASFGARVLLVGVGLTWLTSMLLAALAVLLEIFRSKSEEYQRRLQGRLHHSAYTGSGHISSR